MSVGADPSKAKVYVRTSRLRYRAQHSKNNRPFVLPQLSSPPLVVLPASRTKELAVLAEDEFDIESLNRELAAADYTSKLDYGDTRHMNVVGRQLTISRHLPELIPIIFDELATSMQHRWKPATSMEDQQWTVAEVYPTSMQLVAQVIARVFSGERLGRTPGFADAVIRHTEAIFTAGALIGLIPTLLRPVLAPLLMLVCGIPGLYGAVKSIALPAIKERMTAVSGSGDANSAALPADKPVDMLQWLVEDCMHAADGNNHFRLDDDAMVTRLLHLHMAAIHTTSITVANVIINLYGAGRDHFIGGLQEEVERVLSEHGGEWDMGAINSLHRIDSAIRESMRYTPMSDISLRRVISSRRGVDLSEGLHLPCGTRVVVPAFCIQRDQDIFGMDAGSYDAFRFSRPLEQRTSAASEAQSKLPHPKPQAITSTSESFTAFGHGRHACPGRFFASTLMKVSSCTQIGRMC